MSLFKTEMSNAWADILLDELQNQDIYSEVKELLYKMFSFDRNISDEWYDKGYNRLKELGENTIVEWIDKKYYMMFAGGRE